MCLIKSLIRYHEVGWCKICSKGRSNATICSMFLLHEKWCASDCLRGECDQHEFASISMFNWLEGGVLVMCTYNNDVKLLSENIDQSPNTEFDIIKCVCTILIKPHLRLAIPSSLIADWKLCSLKTLNSHWLQVLQRVRCFYTQEDVITMGVCNWRTAVILPRPIRVDLLDSSNKITTTIRWVGHLCSTSCPSL